MPMMILLVCTGNTCRSSMAEVLLRKYLAERFGVEAGEYVIVSAGVGAKEGECASTEAIDVMAEEGIDLTGHHARLITSELIREANLVLTMTTNHKRKLLDIVPEAKAKVFTLKEYVRPREEVDNAWETMHDYLDNLNEQQERFLRQNQGRLEVLRRRRDELTRELTAVEKELQGLEDGYLDMLLRSRRQLEQLEQRADNLDIVDPFGGTLETYRECAMELKEVLLKLVEKLARQDNGR